MNSLSIALVVILLAVPNVAQADSRGLSPDQAVQVTGISRQGSLNVRRGPGTGHPVIGQLVAGQSGLVILECTTETDWCRVRGAQGPLGWVASRYLVGVAQDGRDVATPPAPRFSEAARLSAVTGIVLEPDETATIPELPPYMLGAWDIDDDACASATSPSRVMVQENGLQIGAAIARFKSAVFRDDGYDLTTLLMAEQEVPNAVPQRALYRLEPGEDTLALSGDVLTTRILRRCSGP